MQKSDNSTFIVSVHIPKTAGTTLSSVFDRCYSRRVIYDYDGYSQPATPSQLILESREFIEQYFRVLHGHFFTSKYKDVFPDAKFISTLRHPVARVISQYNHEINERSSNSWYHDDLVSGRMDVVEFARQPGIGNAFEAHLAGMDLCNYNLILIQEHFRESLWLFDQLVSPLDLETHYGSDLVIPNLNTGQERIRQIEVSSTEKEGIFNCTSADNEIYREAIDLLSEKLRST
jgi:Sulfotransferase family